MSTTSTPDVVDQKQNQSDLSATSGSESIIMPPVPPPNSSKDDMEEKPGLLKQESSLQSLILATNTTNLEDRMTHADVHLDDNGLTDQEIEKKRRMVLDKDRGIWFDIEDIEGNIETEYSLFPSKDELLLNKDQTHQEGLEDGNNEDATIPKSSVFQNQNKISMKDNLKRFSFKGFNAAGNNTEKEDKEKKGENESTESIHHKKKSTFGDLGSMVKKMALTPNPFNLHARGNSGENVNIPHHQVKVHTNNKERCEFGDLRLVQELNAHEGAIWTMKFSLTGEHLASAGQSGVVMIWSVGEKSRDAGDDGVEERVTHEDEDYKINEKYSTNGEGTILDTVKKNFVVPSSSCPFKKVNEGNETETQIYDAIKLLKAKPFRQFVGHTAHVVDLAWHRDNFVLSASMDKTVRLWHVTTNDCLHVFAHHHVVTSVDFHPTIDTCFLTGCFDKKLRIWSVIDGRVKKWAHAPDLITAACFNPEGTMAVAGLFRGQVFFYQTDGMKYYTQIECRNRKGALKTGKKVTGLCFHHAINPRVSKTLNPHFGQNLSYQSSRNINDRGDGIDGDKSNGDSGVSFDNNYVEQLLISTNDSRLRLYQTDDYSMLWKYKGLKNDQMQIKATVSYDGRYIISGSENGNVYIWNIDPTKKSTIKDSEKDDDTKGKKTINQNDEDKAIFGLFAKDDNKSSTRNEEANKNIPDNSSLNVNTIKEDENEDEMEVKGNYGFSFNLNYNLTGYKKDRNTCYEWFNAQQNYDNHTEKDMNDNSETTPEESDEEGDTNPPIIPVALFVPSAAINYACRGTIYEPFLCDTDFNNENVPNINVSQASLNNRESKMIITSDYKGKIKVYMKHSLVKKYL